MNAKSIYPLQDNWPLAIGIATLPLWSWFVYPKLPHWLLDYPIIDINRNTFIIASAMTVMVGIFYFLKLARLPTTSADWLVVLALELNLMIVGPSPFGSGSLPTTAEVREQMRVADVNKRFAEIVAREQQ